MFSLKISLISVIIVISICCDITQSDQNKSNAFNISDEIMDLSPISHKTNETDSSIGSKIGRIHITNGFILRTLFVVTVILSVLSLICMIRVCCRSISSRRWNLSKASKDWPHPKYDTLPTAAINDSIKKNAFVLNDSDDEEFTIFDANQRLIK